MKKYVLSLLALVLCMGMLQANPVDESRAKMVGQQFAQNALGMDAEGIYLLNAASTERGVPCYYIYNIGKDGYVIVSGDDYYRPIIGYSKTAAFDTTNPGLAYYLRTILSGRNKNTGEPTPAVAAEWNRVMNEGYLVSKNAGRGGSFLCATKWNQNYPFNALCPAYSGGPGGHFYAGCVATALAQAMKYWNYPAQGQGSHTYTSQAHPYTPDHPVNIPANTCTANFGATTYDWENMPNTLATNAPQQQIMAVATLIYHCAVAVDMDWDYDGSGSNMARAAERMPIYFNYSNASVYQLRASFAASTWAQKVKESIDMGWPVPYAGVEEGMPYGHAFVVDGYDDNDLYHFNFGWSGSGDDWLTFEGQDYHVNDGGLFNFVPSEVYNTTAQAPTNLTVTPAANNALSATLSWTNPLKTLSNTNISSIDQIVVMRDNDVIATIDNPTPGATMTYVDNEVPRFDYFQYKLYAVCQGSHGKILYGTPVGFGPTCNWTIMMTSNNSQGWRGGYISVQNAAGTEIRTCTTTSSSPSSLLITMPVGRVSFVWHAPSVEISSMNIILKDSENNTVYTYAGSSNDLPEGMIYRANNGCGNELGTDYPALITTVRDEENPFDILVSWDAVRTEGYGYNIYRDGMLYRLIPEATSFVDHNVPLGGHCYYVTYLSYGGETESSNESCVTAGEGCNPPKNLDYETTGASFKIKLKWEKPEITTGLSGFFVYRRAENEAEYKLIKVSGASSTNYTDSSLNTEGVYYYMVKAYYQGIGCTSSPANYKWDENTYFLKVYWSATGVDESVANAVNLFPNPAKDSFTIEAEDLCSVMVYNTIGQMVYSTKCEGNSTVINLNNVESGMYLVKVLTAKGDYVRKISVVK